MAKSAGQVGHKLSAEIEMRQTLLNIGTAPGGKMSLVSRDEFAPGCSSEASMDGSKF